MEHDCSLQRSIGYFLEPLVLLAPFAKKPVKITLRGNTNSSGDPSVSCTSPDHYNMHILLQMNCVVLQVDYYRVCVLPLLKKFLPDSNLHLKVMECQVYVDLLTRGSLWCVFVCVCQILNRGVYPGGGGAVEFSCPVVRRMKPAQMVDCGKVRRIRGVAYPHT